MDRTDPCWLFGYGSLIFRPAIPFVERRPARVQGWTRRFWQWSTDHRGEPWRPGRVVTLAPSPDEACWGMAYRLPEADAEAILADLDVRERGGYVRIEIELELEPPAEGASGPAGSVPQVVAGLTYQGWPGNRNYAGPASITEIASQVAEATGPSGTNADYVLDLYAALESLGAEDAHVADLAARLRDYARGRKVAPPIRDAILDVSERCAALPDLDTRPADEILGYDERGGLSRTDIGRA